MQSLWRALALAWLGGIASPALAEPPPATQVVAEDGIDDDEGRGRRPALHLESRDELDS